MVKGQAAPVVCAAMATARERRLKAFGKRLAELRKAAGLTQERLAEKSALHPNYIGDLERGHRNPTLMTLHALAKGLGCGVAELVDDLPR